MARYINIHETASTNTYLARMATMLPSGTVIYTHHQSAGRGQRGNSWEAEPGKNLTVTLADTEESLRHAVVKIDIAVLVAENLRIGQQRRVFRPYGSPSHDLEHVTADGLTHLACTHRRSDVQDKRPLSGARSSPARDR